MSFDEWVHLVHILAAMIWVGGLTVLTASAIHIRRSGDRAAIGRFIESLRVLGPTVLAPGPVLVLASGIWSVASSDAWSFGQTWVWVALALVAAALAFGAGVQSRVAIRAARAVAGGDDGDAARLLGRWVSGSLLILALLLVATWDMVAKPGL